MYKNQILSSLNKIANSLDKSGIFEEADKITNIMIKFAQQSDQKSDQELEQPYNSPEVKKQVDSYRNKLREFQNKIYDNENNISELYNLKKLLTEKSEFNNTHTYSLMHHIDTCISDLEAKYLTKFKYNFSKPYFDSNLNEFIKIGNEVENDPEFKSLHVETQRKLRTYYFDLKSKLEQRNELRENKPLQNISELQKNPKQLISFISQNLQYEANKLVNPQTLQVMMQDYLSDVANLDVEVQLRDENINAKIKELAKQYNLPEDDLEIDELAEKLIPTTKTSIMYDSRIQKIDAMRRSIHDILDSMKKLVDSILKNAKRDKNSPYEYYAEDLNLLTSECSSVQILQNLYFLMEKNQTIISDSVEAAESLKKTVEDVYQKIGNQIFNKANANERYFGSPRNQEDLDQRRKFYTPIYPDVKPPE